MPKMRLLKWIAEYKAIVAARELKPSTVAEKSRAADFLGETIGNKKLKKIRPAQIALACRSVWDSGQHAKARRILVTARDLFGEAVANGYLPINPALHVRPLSNRVKRARLSIRQWRRVQKHLAKSPTPWKRHLALLALITGQRRGDLAKMQFSDVWKEHLHVVQAKTGERIALRLKLRCKAVAMSLQEVVESCRNYDPPGETLLRKSTGAALSQSSLTKAFRDAFAASIKWRRTDRTMPCLQECRSLAERLYSAQGINTQMLLGHRKPSTTALYHDDRGLGREEGRWRTLRLPKQKRR